MVLFIIGVIGIITVCTLGLFLPCYYTKGWGYANLHGFKAYSETYLQSYRLLDNCLNSWPLYLLLAVIILGLIIYTVLMLCKKSNLVSNVIIFVLAIAPFALMFFNMNMLREDAKFIQATSSLVIGAGIDSGLTSIGRLLIVVQIISFILLVIGFSLNHKKLLATKTKNPPKEIKTTKKPKEPVSKYDFKL